MNEKIYEYGNRNGRLGYNFCVDVFAHGYENLSRILSIAFCSRFDFEPPKTATHYLVDKDYGLVFFHARSENGIVENWVSYGLKVFNVKEFTPPLDVSQITDFAWKWLKETEYPSPSENDGIEYKGWRVYNEEAGIVGSHNQTVVAVKPFWIYIGK